MPRPRKNPDLLLVRELRITPYDQEPIDFESHLHDGILQLVVAEEGTPNGVPRLHYHAVIHTTMTSQALSKWLRTLARAPKEVNGNAVFFTKEPHEHTYGYVVKNKKIVLRHGYDQRTIDEYFSQSDDYVKTVNRDRKRKQRTREQELQDIVDEVERDLKTIMVTSIGTVTPADAIERILERCHIAGVRFPSRSQMEYYANRLVYPYNSSIVIQYYARSYPILFSS